ncbi:MAG: hypothetical protein AAF799_12190 [Myxococcota bacterium]
MNPPPPDQGLDSISRDHTAIAPSPIAAPAPKRGSIRAISTIGRWASGGALAAVACGPGTAAPTRADGSSTGAAMTPSSSTGSADPAATTATSVDGTGLDETDFGGFVDDPDIAVGFECDIFLQDCPSGHKCIPYDDRGGGYPTTWGCVPLGPEPVDLDEPCSWDGAPFASSDDCGVGALCFDHEQTDDPSDDRCLPMCEREGPSEVSCRDPELFCNFTGNSAWFVCARRCHPLLDDCPAAEVCANNPNGLFCQDSPPDPAGLGEPCDSVAGCEVGSYCIGPAATVDCGGVGCCTPWCIIGDDTCPPDHTCQPYYTDGSAPQGHEGLGVCALPP